ncbi:MAG: TetR/AcrR family transcriptional regulator [Endozoicomonas sp.]
MSRQQKRIEREVRIVSAAIELLEEKSFLDLRMSEVAQTAECSMGAVYSHFSSKEDLLLACAYEVTKDKRDLLQRVISSELNCIEQMIMVSLLIWLTDNLKPQHYQLRQLAMNPSIWKRASSHRNNVMNDLGATMQSLMTGIARKVLTEHMGEPVSEELATQLEMGLCGMSMGLYQFKESGFGVFNDIMSEDDCVDLHLSNIERHLTGWGLQYDGMSERIRELIPLAEALVNR